MEGTDPALCLDATRDRSSLVSPLPALPGTPRLPRVVLDPLFPKIGWGTCVGSHAHPQARPLHRLLFPSHLLNPSARQGTLNSPAKPLGSKLGHVPFLFLITVISPLSFPAAPLEEMAGPASTSPAGRAPRALSIPALPPLFLILSPIQKCVNEATAFQSDLSRS